MPRSRQYLTVMLVAAACVGIYLLAGRLAFATPLTQTPTPAPRMILLTDPVPESRQPGVLWFAPTGHTLRGNFLDYWNKHGGLPQFGYPITEEFTEPIGPEGAPIMVQYFERARFEHHPENASTPHEVLLGALGREFHPQDPPARPLPSPDVFPPTRVYFNETGHNLGGAFLRYWNEHGGLAIHGYPISEEFEEKSPTDGKTYRVQYFERSRFELHPANKGTPHEVLLGLLGSTIARQKGYFRGVYPQTGRAGDFSWISGRLAEHQDTGCLRPRCGCSTLLFGGPKDKAYLEGTWWRQYERTNFIPGNTYLVAFGRAIPPDAREAICPIPLGLPPEQIGIVLYIPSGVQLN